jgi:hypothetical protein
MAGFQPPRLSLFALKECYKKQVPSKDKWSYGTSLSATEAGWRGRQEGAPEDKLQHST